MSPRRKETLTLVGEAALAFCLLATACLRLIPKPHGPLHYMVAGALGTAVALAVGFSSLNWRGGSRRLSFMRRVPVLRIRYVRRGATP